MRGMADVLWLILLVLLCLLAAVLLLFALALTVRTGIETYGANGAVSVELRYGPLRIPLWPPPKAQSREQAAEGAPPERKARKKAKPRRKYRFDRAALDIGELLELALRLLDELAGTLRISRLRVRVVIGTDDAAKTGILLGQSAALTGMIVPFLENTFEMKDYRVDVDADFNAAHTEWAFSAFCSMRPVRLLFLLLRHAKELFGLYKKLIKKEEAITHE